MSASKKPEKSEETLVREKEQRERLAARLVGRPRPPFNLDDYCAPIFYDEDGYTT